MRSLFQKAIFLFLIAGVVTSCADKDSPNYHYFPDMAYPVAYETYGEYDIFVNGQQAKLPVEGTIPRGWKPFDYTNDAEGRANAKENLENPLPYTEDNYNEGKQLYTIYCAVCHGDNGDGQGILAEREKILGVPAYDDPGRAITEGGVYHVMYYGLNAMGSYASQTSEEERWKITHYVMDLKDQLAGNESREFIEEEEGSNNLQPSESESETPGQDEEETEQEEEAEEATSTNQQ